MKKSGRCSDIERYFDRNRIKTLYASHDWCDDRAEWSSLIHHRLAELITNHNTNTAHTVSDPPWTTQYTVGGGTFLSKNCMRECWSSTVVLSNIWFLYYLFSVWGQIISLFSGRNPPKLKFPPPPPANSWSSWEWSGWSQSWWESWRWCPLLVCWAHWNTNVNTIN